MSLLRKDPTRTKLLRDKFSKELVSGFVVLKKLIYEFLVTKDKLRLKGATTNAWKFEFKKSLLENFNSWLLDKVSSGILKQSLVNKFVRDGYLRGTDRGYDDATLGRRFFASGKVTEGIKADFRRSARTKVMTLQNLQARTFRDLKGVTDSMAAQISRVLSDGLLAGDNPEEIARKINDRVDKIGITRARTIARTELVRAHAEGVLDALESLGETTVGINVEWKTGSDPCPECQPLEGMVLTIAKARGMFPRHPNCLCSPVPTSSKANHNRLSAKIRRSVAAGKRKAPTSSKKKTKRSGVLR